MARLGHHRSLSPRSDWVCRRETACPNDTPTRRVDEPLIIIAVAGHERCSSARHSSYKALVTDAERVSLVMTGQGQRTAVMDVALARRADRVRRAYEEAKAQRIRVRIGARRSWPGTCPRCGAAIDGVRVGSVVVCSGCGSSILFTEG